MIGSYDKLNSEEIVRHVLTDLPETLDMLTLGGPDVYVCDGNHDFTEAIELQEVAVNFIKCGTRYPKDHGLEVRTTATASVEASRIIERFFRQTNPTTKVNFI